MTVPSTSAADTQGPLPGTQEQQQVSQLQRLDANQSELARLFAGLPSVDSALKNLLARRLTASFEAAQLRSAWFAQGDPDSWFVNRFADQAPDARVPVAAQSFSEQLRACLLHDVPPRYELGRVGFFCRPDSVEEADSLFVEPLQAPTLRTMESIFYLARPWANEQLIGQLRDDFRQFSQGRPRASLAQLLAQRYLHLLDLYRADQMFASQSSEDTRRLQAEDERLLASVHSHPAQAQRSQLPQASAPRLYALGLESDGVLRRWPAAMVIRQSQRPSLFLYTLEGGLQRFGSERELLRTVRPTLDGKTWRLRDMDSELTGHAFETAADELLQLQGRALDVVLTAPPDKVRSLEDFARQVEAALALPMLAVAGPLAVRQQALVENSRGDFYKSATALEKARYRRLENQAIEAAQGVGEGIPTLWQFTGQAVRKYLQQHLHPGIDPDPDRSRVILSFGASANPRHSRIASLTQLMLENLRPEQYPNALREVHSVHLVDASGQRIRNPANGYLFTLSGAQLAQMTTHIDAGGRYEALLRDTLNQPSYKAAWQAAYLASLEFKAYEAALRGNEVFDEELHDERFDPPKPCKRATLWLDAVLQSPQADGRATVQGRAVQVHGLLLGGSEDLSGQYSAAGAASVDGALILCDRAQPHERGRVVVYFPDSPDGNDLHEFADLGEGVSRLLQRKEWQEYFRSRLSAADPLEIDRLLGQRGARPLIRGVATGANFLENLHRAHVNFQSAWADERSNSNRDLRLATAIRLAPVIAEGVMDLLGMLLVPGFRLLRQALKIGLLMHRSGLPIKRQVVDFIALVNRVSNAGGGGLVPGVKVAARGRASFLSVAAAHPDEAPGLPLEPAIYGRYAVADSALVQGLTANARGFYRATLRDPASGRVTAHPLYIRQPDGTLFRVHDHTRLDAGEAVLVDPLSGASLRASGLTRSTVARMPDGEWRAVGFGLGGGKRSAEGGSGDATPAKVPASGLSAVSAAVRQAGHWDGQAMDLVPSIMTRLALWPAQRSLLIIDELADDYAWSVRFTPGQEERIYPLDRHPEQSPEDLVLRRVAQNHYHLVLNDQVVQIPADGDCFFNAVAQGLNAGQASQAFTIQGLRQAAADYLEQHPQLGAYLAPQASAMQQALYEHAQGLEYLMGESALAELSRIVHGAANPLGLFQPALGYLNRHLAWLARLDFETLGPVLPRPLPVEVLQIIGRYMAPRPAAALDAASRAHRLEPASLQRFYEDLLLGPTEPEDMVALLGEKHLMLNQNVTLIMLEYGVSARQLLYYHPKDVADAYVLFNEARHGHLGEQQLYEMLDGAQLVDEDDLAQTAQRLQAEQRIFFYRDLFDHYTYYRNVDETVGLLRASLRRFAALRERAEILLGSRTIASHLGGMLSLSEVADWLRDPRLSEERLRIIARYANSRYDEVERNESIDISWMQPFEDDNLRRIVNHQNALVKFFGFLQGRLLPPDINECLRWFSVTDQPLSQNRVTLLLDTQPLWAALQRWPVDRARRAWDDLVGPYFSDATLRQALERVDVFASPGHFEAALMAGLSPEEARANRIVQEVLGHDIGTAQRYLHGFDFPTDRVGRSRLDFALYLQGYLQVPQWAGQYARNKATSDL